MHSGAKQKQLFSAVFRRCYTYLICVHNVPYALLHIMYIMNTFTGSYDYGYASALAVISTMIMMVVAFIYIRFGKMGQMDN